MNTCRRCDTYFTPLSHDELCGVCSRRQRTERLCDPKDKVDFMRRLDYLAGVRYTNVGRCIICKAPIDDHRLTYTNAHTPTPMCVKNP